MTLAGADRLRGMLPLDACHATSSHLARRRAQVWKELPQPQLFLAFGLLKVKPRLSIPS
jgi:hypothetical protein